MTIFELGALGEFVGSIVVAVTLVVLIFQIRQNTRSVDESRQVLKAQAYQDRATAAQEISLRFACSEFLTGISEKLYSAGFPDNSKSLDAVTPQELRAFRSYLLAQQIRIDNQYYQYQQGLIDEVYYQNNIKFQIQAIAPSWKALSQFTGRPDFVAEVDRILAEDSDLSGQ